MRKASHISFENLNMIHRAMNSLTKIGLSSLQYLPQWRYLQITRNRNADVAKVPHSHTILMPLCC